MNDNCDMNLFNPENMEIKPGKIGSFIPKYSKLIVSERYDSTCCIEFEIAGRDYEFNMSKEQAVKLARGILSLSGEERPQGELKEYKPLEPDYNVQCAVENLKTAYWSNDSEKFAKVFTDAEEIIVSAICHHGYSVCKQPQGEWKTNKSGNVYCSECNTIKMQAFNKFCSFCGADMRKGGAKE